MLSLRQEQGEMRGDGREVTAREPLDDLLGRRRGRWQCGGGAGDRRRVNGAQMTCEIVLLVYIGARGGGKGEMARDRGTRKARKELGNLGKFRAK